MTIDVNMKLNITDENIADIVESAFCDTSLWSGYCGGYPVTEIPKGVYVGNYIANGGEFVLTDPEDDDTEYLLTKNKIVDGIKKMFIDVGNSFNEWGYKFNWIEKGKIIDMDSLLADCIIQYGIFGEIVYG